MSDKDIAVLGAGRMGSGIAQVFLAAGHRVSLYDLSAEVLAVVPQRILSYFELLEQDPVSMSLLSSCASVMEAVAAADVIIEAVPERLEVKLELFREVDAHAKESALFASNTSAIAITQIAEGVADKRRFLGMHFWNPPHLIPLVEVVQAKETSAESIARAMVLLSGVGFEPVHVQKDIPGFIGNRLQHALKCEAIALVANGVCDAETIDKVVKQGFGSRLVVLGPLEQSDMFGLDMTLDVHRVLIRDLDVTPGPSPYLEAKVAAGELGMKTGRGFRNWSPEQVAAVRSRVDAFLLQAAKTRRSQRWAR
jgi:3-hydroxybutyryl-CoA dehydrogenase